MEGAGSRNGRTISSNTAALKVPVLHRISNAQGQEQYA